MLETQNKKEDLEEISPYDVAIVGMTGRFPGARDIEEFERNLRDGICSITQFTEEELLAAGVGEAEFNQPNYVRARGWLEDIEFFDARYFGYSPLEAKLMDPQHRIFLEGCVTALENAGYDSHRYAGAISVFAGVSSSPYVFRLFANENLASSVGDIQALMGFDKDFVPTRVSYKLNLKGASFNVQTACSTSLVAVHLACQTLLNGQSDIALAGGVSIGVPSKQGYSYTPGGVSSPDGLCRAFDAEGKGVPGGNGMGIVVLKRLTDALTERDTIYAVIKGSAINNDGSDKIGFTAPSVEGQTAVITEALAVADVAPETISYVETHGTATELGDPIEIAALTQAFTTEKRNYCAIGSLKTNIGHTDVAAGVAGLIKTALAIKKGEIPPSLNFSKPNLAINFAESPFYVNTKLREWKTETGVKRRAGVSSFGIGGTNAHLILEEPPKISRDAEIEQPQLILLSANSENALEKMTENLAAVLEKNPDTRLDDVAYTLQTGRKFLSERKAIVCSNKSEAVKALRGETDFVSVNCVLKNKSAVVFMFPGGGAQYVEMARGLYDSHEIFRRELDHCFALIGDASEKSMREFLYPSTDFETQNSELIRRPSIGLPILFAVEYALAELWMSFGVRPAAMVGHSLGEYVAACLSGVFSIADAMKLVALRGRLFEKLPAGAMLSVALSETETRKLLPENLEIAALNAPQQTLVAGSREAIADFAEKLSEKFVEAKILRVDTASHSRFVEPILREFRDFIENINLHSPQIPYISNVTGDWAKNEDVVSPDYWIRHLREAVKFADGIKKLAAQENDLILLEIGSGTLGALAHSCFGELNFKRDYSAKIVNSLKHPLEKSDDAEVFLAAVGKLWANGIEIDWEALHKDEKPFRIALPTYPFERERYWIDEVSAKPKSNVQGKRKSVASWFYTPTWERAILLQEKTETETKWLIFARNKSKTENLQRILSDKNCEAQTVVVGEEFSRIGNNSYALNPQNFDDCQKLVSILNDENKLPNHVLFFADFGADGENIPIDALNIFCSPLYLLQNLNEVLSEKRITLGIVTEDFFEVNGNEEKLSSPIFSAVAGITRTASQEFADITAFWADIESNHDDKQLTGLIGEFQNQEAGRTIAFRGNYRWRQKYQATPLTEKNTVIPRFQNGGTYLLTGGLGGIALEIAEELAKHYSANLVLVSRKKFLSREVWEEFFESEETDKLTKKTLGKLLQIEKIGGQVLILSADAGDKAQLQNALKTTKNRFGKIDGVIHAAGVFPGGMMHFKERKNVEEVFSAKVSGTIWLDELLGDEPDFVAYFSSLNSLTGGFGQSDYCAANAFLDNFVFRKKREKSEKPFYISINWDAWQETGGAFNVALPTNLSDYREINLRDKILNREGKDAFFRAISSPLSQAIVSVREFETLVSEELAAKPMQALEFIERETKQTQQSHKRPKLAAVYKPPHTPLEKQIAELWQNLLGIEEIGINDNFFELGGHSLLATQLTAWLRREFTLEMPLRKIFEFPTVAKWAKAVEVLFEDEIVSKDGLLDSLSRQGLENSLLVPFETDSTGEPLFLIHAMSGTSSVYQPLVENLAVSRPVYGVEAIGLNGTGKPLETVEAMSESYLTAIESINGDKPIHLCGWSFGGLIAFEMARKLNLKGKIASLILIDTPAQPDEVNEKLNESETLVYMAQMFSDEIKIDAEELAQFDYQAQLELVLEKLKKEKLVPAGLRSEALQGYVNVFRANCRAIADYRLKPCEMPLNLIRLADKNAVGALALSNDLLGWNEFVGDLLNVRIIEGNHYTIIKEPQVKILAECLDEIMKGKWKTKSGE